MDWIMIVIFALAAVANCAAVSSSDNVWDKIFHMAFSAGNLILVVLYMIRVVLPIS